MIQLLHITDMHVCADPEATLKGIHTRQSLAMVLKAARRRLPQPELVILGGDLAQDGSAAAYAHIATLFDSLPTLAVAGNHDAPEHLQAHFAHRAVDMGNWRIIPLHTHHAGHEGGLLGERQLAGLASSLDDAADRHVLLALHHPPLPVGSRWLDAIGLADADAFRAVVARYPNVRGVLCGHIHQAFEQVHQGVRVLGTPASCIQFRPRRPVFELDNQSPGYRWMRLMPDGEIVSGVERISGFIPPDLADNVPY